MKQRKQDSICLPRTRNLYYSGGRSSTKRMQLSQSFFVYNIQFLHGFLYPSATIILPAQQQWEGPCCIWCTATTRISANQSTCHRICRTGPRWQQRHLRPLQTFDAAVKKPVVGEVARRGCSLLKVSSFIVSGLVQIHFRESGVTGCTFSCCLASKRPFSVFARALIHWVTWFSL